ncbi:non-ribosomal peptide synthetase [Mycobacterium sp. ACS1612]|uniref:non-ribosomal peptide synthetase n=1 Tax=Mycobacterium sp. ACS1612 TaxID=1834117 RepID=UPI0007FCDA61|nr:non-ribosomal peptide synthetase [Mycobacterium sp. ACS1612]OBF36771.1 non-ribosomal peptide synthetase [Mycobacterium sp. ACS1612]
MTETIGRDVDIADLSADEKRALLSRLLRERVESSAATHPLSFGQRSLWLLENLSPGSPAHIITYTGLISGELDVAALERAAQALVDRNAILRTTYGVRDGQPIQRVHPRWQVRMARQDLDPGEYGLQNWLRRESNRPFDLETGPVFRLTLLRRGPQDHILVLAIHHIAVDFWSLDILLDELRLLYAAQFGAEAPDACAETYVQHARRQNRALEGEYGDRLWKYWREQLSGDLPVTNLPTDRPRRQAQTYRGAVHHFTIDAELAAALKEIGRRAGATPYMTLLAGYATLLHRYNGQTDLPIGSPFACRESAAIQELVGYLANPLVLRADMSGDPTFAALLARIKQTVLGALEHQEFPFSLLVDRLHPVRDASHAPLFQVSFAWEQVRRFRDAGQSDGANSLNLTSVQIGQGGALSDLMLLMGELDGRLIGALQYNTDLFDQATIERMSGHFLTLLRGVVADPGKRLSQLPLLTDAESREQKAWNRTQVSYDAPDCLHELVAQAAQRHPAAVAVSFEDRHLTYGELDRRADALAHRLQALGVGTDTLVPVLLDRSEDLVIALLAALKAGGAFMPLDPAQPANRIAAMLSGVPGAPVCLTHQCHLDKLTGFSGEPVCLDRLSPSLSGHASPSSVGVTRRNLAYVVHTSGSTGTPKGALNTHGGIRNRLLWMQQTDPLGVGDRVLHQTPVAFDVSVLEIFWPLIAGAQIVIAKPDGHTDVEYIANSIAENQITAAFFVPTTLRSFLAQPAAKECEALRHVSCGGDIVPYELTQRFHATVNAELWNEYGPAEAAVTATYFHCKRGASGPSVPIGRPIANVHVYLLDTHRQPVPIGVIGELYIGGAGVGRGYLNHPDATAASFSPDPFAEADGQLMYRTGDLARYLPDGNIEYIGRRDDQVKVRGVRIELGEIEAALAKHPAIRDSAVVAGPDDRGNTRLVAHLVAGDQDRPSTTDMRLFLRDQLPASMVPAVFCFTEALPQTPGGKVDRRALGAASAATPTPDREFVAPRTPAEKILTEIWSEVLDVENVGIHDDFFALGGCSTHSMEVTVKAKAAGIALTPEAVFVCGTIAELAAQHGGGVAERVTATPEAATTLGGSTVIESIGTYLPAEVVSTEAVVAGCTAEVGIPLGRLTGILNRRVVGPGEYASDLARQAIDDCLARSSHEPDDIDLIVACNTSRYDGPEFRLVFEPGTAVRLRDRCGLSNALAFDISNACAGMWTGITVADAYLKTGQIRRAMVVSGEYISLLAETAQKEIEGPMDPRLACLTLGDAGAAVILERSANDRIGFHDIDMATLGAYSRLCVAKPSEGPHGGAVMVTDSIAATVVAVKAAVPYVAAVMRRHGWRPQNCDHLLIHQTSESSLRDAMLAINREFGKTAAHPGNTIFNLAERGNTASTSHWVALKDHILNNRIQSGDRMVFGISGSGQTVGAALYTFDDLPDRLRLGRKNRRTQSVTASRTVDVHATPRVRIAGVGTVPAGTAETHSVANAVRAAKSCLENARLEPSQLGLLIHAGVYRDEFIGEPAIATFIAGDIGANDDIQSADGTKTLAFDVFNGAVGFLNACQVAAQMIGGGKVQNAMVVTSETENNAADGVHQLLGVQQTGSAVVLSRSDDAVGFGGFVFRYDPEHADALTTYTRQAGGRTWLQIDREPKLATHYLDMVPAAVEELLELENLDRSDIKVVVPPFLPVDDRTELAHRIGIDSARFVEFDGEDDPFTSSVPQGIERAVRQGLAAPGDIGLIVTVGSGLQVGCTTYRF